MQDGIQFTLKLKLITASMVAYNSTQHKLQRLFLQIVITSETTSGLFHSNDFSIFSDYRYRYIVTCIDDYRNICSRSLFQSFLGRESNLKRRRIVSEDSDDRGNDEGSKNLMDENRILKQQIAALEEANSKLKEIQNCLERYLRDVWDGELQRSKNSTLQEVAALTALREQYTSSQANTEALMIQIKTLESELIKQEQKTKKWISSPFHIRWRIVPVFAI